MHFPEPEYACGSPAVQFGTRTRPCCDASGPISANGERGQRFCVSAAYARARYSPPPLWSTSLDTATRCAETGLARVHGSTALPGKCNWSHYREPEPVPVAADERDGLSPRRAA